MSRSSQFFASRFPAKGAVVRLQLYLALHSADSILQNTRSFAYEVLKKLYTLGRQTISVMLRHHPVGLSPSRVLA